VETSRPSGPGRRIAVGRTAEILEWDQGRVLKLLFDGFPGEWISSELSKISTVRSAGASAPAVYGQVEIEGRPGMVVERIDAPSMLDRVVQTPWRVGPWGGELARIHQRLLACRPKDLPDVKEVLAQRIEHADPLPGPQRSRAKDTLLALPDGEALLHGDFHPGNVLLAEGGPVPIDWKEAARGNEGADIARTSWLLSAATIPADLPRRRLAVALVGLLRASYLTRIRRLTGLDRSEIGAWRLPVLSARLAEGIDTEEHALLASIDRLG